MQFNAEYGYLEAVLRGFRSGFLKDSEYRQICQCENLEDVKLALGDTDYLNVLQNQAILTPDIMVGGGRGAMWTCAEVLCEGRDQRTREKGREGATL